MQEFNIRKMPYFAKKKLIENRNDIWNRRAIILSKCSEKPCEILETFY